jgi:two-component system, NtrC family, nitrogen regulation sensor histidine kinase NtrY
LFFVYTKPNQNKLKSFFKKYQLFVALLLFIIFVLLAKVSLQGSNFRIRKIEQFQKTLNKKESRLNSILDKLRAQAHQTGSDNITGYSIDYYCRSISKEGFSVFIYDHDTLRLWSDNSTALDYNLLKLKKSPNIIETENGFYLVKTRKFGHKLYVGLLLIKYNYPYENKFLKNYYQKDFQLKPEVKLSLKQGVQGTNVYNLSDQFLFSLDFSLDSNKTFINTVFPIILYVLSFFILLMIFYQVIKMLSPGVKRNSGLFLLALLLILLKYFAVKYKFPSAIFNTSLFKPEYYAIDLIPSIGDLLINTLLLFFYTLTFYRLYPFSKKVCNNKGLKIKSSFCACISFNILYFIFIYFLFRGIILNSTISFEAYKILELSVNSFIGLFILALHFAIFCFITDKILIFYGKCFSLKQLIIYFLILSVVICAVFWYYFGLSLISSLFLMAIWAVLLFFRYRPKYYSQFSSLVFIAFLFSVYTVWQITTTSEEKEMNKKKVLAVNLATERDLVSEMLLDELADRFSDDKHFTKMMLDSTIQINKIYQYIQRKYFSGFWQKYDIQITVCNPDDSLYLRPPDNSWTHCYTFFNEIVNQYGVKLTNSKFYFLEKNNGQISYLGWLDFVSADRPVKRTLFIELSSKLVSEELGYPELLLEGKLAKSQMLKDYSNAKYYKGELIAQSGDYNYPLKADQFGTVKEEYTFFPFGDYNHLVYRIDQNSTIVISKISPLPFDIIISFSYIFVFSFILLTLVILVTNHHILRKSFQSSFKNRIQFYMILLLSISLLTIGVITVYYSIRQFKNKQNEMIGEKIQSVYSELQDKLEFEKKLNTSWYSNEFDNLDEMFIHFSNIFYTDINLYDTNGKLLATSRPEVFEKGLTGSMVDPEAFKQIGMLNQPEFIHEEHIGNMKFLSAYVPFVNRQSKLLAILNLPYFTKQDVFTKEISSLIVTLVNIYVLFILLTIGWAVVLSNKIAKPIKVMQKRLSEIGLGKKNERINYVGNDEIGSLVNEYNRMVEELSKNVELLAKSERETAWREMAKQVAHEIKNPLTPMKLSIQHLQRAWKDKVPDWDAFLNRVSKTLIEQIDTLSAISTEFSNFAKMPQAINEEVDVILRLNTTVSLFENSEHFSLVLNTHGIKSALIIADKEQMQRVFINLVKNAIQSLNSNRKGLITIDVFINDVNVIIKISDNGNGIPTGLREKLFQPNFTTKSSGMGLGLAIVKNVIDHAKGSISYETKIDVGTVFIIELPLKKE